MPCAYYQNIQNNNLPFASIIITLSNQLIITLFYERP